MREDFEHTVKFGTLHGKVFVGGIRVRRADGNSHSRPLPEGPIPRKSEDDHTSATREATWSLRDAEEGKFLATFAELEVNLVVTDGPGKKIEL